MSTDRTTAVGCFVVSALWVASALIGGGDNSDLAIAGLWGMVGLLWLRDAK